MTALMLVSRGGFAAPPDPVESLIEEGVNLRVQGKYEEALERFRRAHDLSPSARTLAQIGLAEGSLRRWVDAEKHLSSALASHDTPWIEIRRNREALGQALSSIRAHIGTVAVLGPEGAVITIDRKPAGRLPLAEPLRLAEGTARLEATAFGRRPAASQVTVVGGTESTVILDLPVPPPEPLLVEAPAPSNLFSAEEPTPSSRWKTWTGASLLGVSAVVLATGIVWLAMDGNPLCDAPAGATCYWLRDTKTQGWIAVAAGAAFGVTGGILLWQGQRSDAHLQLGPSALIATGRF